METDAMQNYNISVQLPETDILVDDQSAYPGFDQLPLNTTASLGSRSQISTVPKMSHLHSAGDEVSKLSLFAKVDDVPNSSRSSRRRSILESTMLEQSGMDKLISTSDHAISSILGGHIGDFVKIIKSVTEVEDSLTENVLEINPMQNFLAHAKKIYDPKFQRSASRCNSGSTKGLKEDLDAAVDFIQSESGRSASTMQKFYNDKIISIVDDRKTKLKSLQAVKNGINAAQKNALDAEVKRNEEALKGFSLKLENPMLPKVPLKLDDIPFKACNLVTDPPGDIGIEEIPLDQKIKNLMDKIKKVDIKRTNSSIKKGWWIDAGMRIIDIEKHGVLEMDTDSINALNGALEAQKHLNVSPNLIHSGEELKILQRMNSRKTYLKNPRFNNYSVLPNINQSFDSIKHACNISSELIERFLL
jgi:hypothetical protein